MEQQVSGRHRDFEGIIDKANQNQIRQSNTEDNIRNAVDNIVVAVENRMHEAIRVSIAMNTRGAAAVGFNLSNGRGNLEMTEETKNSGLTHRKPILTEEELLEVFHGGIDGVRFRLA